MGTRENELRDRLYKQLLALLRQNVDPEVEALVLEKLRELLAAERLSVPVNEERATKGKTPKRKAKKKAAKRKAAKRKAKKKAAKRKVAKRKAKKKARKRPRRRGGGSGSRSGTTRSKTKKKK